MPLNIDSYDGKQLAISSVILCKRFRDATVAAQEATAVNLAPRYVPLVSKGVQFTPTGDTTFRKGEPSFAYFEVYEPLLTGTPAATVQTQLRITDVKTGQIKVDTGSRSAADWIEPGKSAIHIAVQIDVAKLPPSTYRLEVQATDSAGKRTVWRAANFTVE
jgi:predicted phage tail protein